ncbi:hypothetical protein CkaCkLH20_06865 [Colletotrichum karsti]|uniref:Alpha/beta hydrolase fold-3 domain-containing protein n=1 Tax=Colletotrichum karsti TaxID=1095194 RepID=A0A9P6I3R1_9PEZI|nr:uncharacterized protein CkaCkLH20_06865 [Colletotrichum karsti]KAF9875484.1 hypothetical protein CkaCkLH20_06865 [Colletotrichum karsti]
MDILWQYLPSKAGPGMEKASWPPCDTNFDDAGPALTGFNRPTRYEGEVRNLEVYGKIPASISGTFYRIMPEPYHVPWVKNDIWLNGDGAISSFRIKNGKVDFKQRFVHTEKFRVEQIENRALIGKYRNPWTDLVKFADRTTANTTALPFKGVILALKEDSQPYAVDPRTLETIGKWTFDGQLESETFTAHPKYDVLTRELLAFGYEGKGIGSRDVFYMSIDEHGKFTEKVWFQAPFCGFQHEMAFTDNWWFEGPNQFTGHVANAFEENGKIHLQASLAKGNGFGFFPDKNGKAPPFDEPSIQPYVTEFIIDPKSDKLFYEESERLVQEPDEFPRIDDRVMGQKNRFIYGMIMDMASGVTDWEYSATKIGAGLGHMNTLYKHDIETGRTQKYHRGNRHFFQEPQFVPRHSEAAEGDGFLISLVSNFDEMTSELVILDCSNFEEHLALVKLPVRLRPGFHGNWVDDADIDGRPVPTKTYVYKQVPNGDPIEADVHYQADGSKKSKPIAIYYHGGNFVVGNKGMIQPSYIRRLLELGFGAVVSPNYRLSPTISAYDGPITDSRDAYVWAQTELPGKLAKDAGVELDGEKIVTWGHSAGGTLALLMASMPKPPEAILDLFGLKYIRDASFRTPAKLPPIELPSVEFRNRIYQDIPPPSASPPPFGPKGPDISNPRSAWLLGKMKDGTFLEELVPDGDYERVDPTTLFSSTFPPTFFGHGGADESVSVELAEWAHKALKEHGVDTELLVVDGAGHGFDMGKEPGDPAYEAVMKGLEFLRAHV